MFSCGIQLWGVLVSQKKKKKKKVFLLTVKKQNQYLVKLGCTCSGQHFPASFVFACGRSERHPQKLLQQHVPPLSSSPGEGKGCSTPKASNSCSAETVSRKSKCLDLLYSSEKNSLFQAGKVACTQIGTWRRGRELVDKGQVQICLE